MDQAYIPWSLFIILGIRFLISELTDDSKQTPQPEGRKGLRYYVNGTQIDNAHHLYYLQKLNITEREAITYKLIQAAARKEIHELIEEDKFHYVFVNEIKAARTFLCDQWCYAAYLN
jgi:hypothetical protein